jgi:Fur family peroxide stress response transcriptional regulator
MKRGLDPQRLRERFHTAGLALTHQRLVLYEELANTDAHPSPEAVFERARKRLPSLSLATVYNNIKAFVSHGIVQEVSVHHGSLRLDSKLEPHHHLVCVRCKRIVDLEASDLEPVKLKKRLPRGFVVHRLSVEILGVCRECAAKPEQ